MHSAQSPLRARLSSWLAAAFSRPTSSRASAAAAAHAADPLSAFRSESDAAEDAVDAPVATLSPDATAVPSWIAPAASAAIVVLVFVAGIAIVAKRGLGVAAAEVKPATVSIDSRPSGADVVIDGQHRGVTPLTLALAAGAHTLAVRRGAAERVVPLTTTAGAERAEHFDLDAEPAPASTGRISVITDPPGARVFVDGQARGVSPLTIDSLPAADHTVRAVAADTTADRVVSVGAGTTTSVVFSRASSAAPLGGWLTVAAPFEVQVLERDEVVGTSESARLMLPAGRHDVVLVNQPLGYQEARRIEVAPGKVTTLKVAPPKSVVSVNARPWADVTLDGASIGQTPIANLAVPIGSHEIVFRHPQLGERKQTLVVTAKGPNRIAADLTR